MKTFGECGCNLILHLLRPRHPMIWAVVSLPLLMIMMTDEINALPQQQRRRRQLLRVSVLVHAKYPERIKSAWLKRHHLLRRKPSQERQQQQQQQQQKQAMHHQHYSNINNRFHSGSYQQASSQPPPPAAAAFHTRRPEWGSIEITRAMIDLLQAGLKIGQVEGGEVEATTHHSCDNNNDNDVIFVNDTDDNNSSSITPVDRFIFVSESCLPVVTLAEMEMALFGPHMDDKRSNVVRYKIDNGGIKHQSRNG